ncbi:hypothetical protein D1224_06620 [Henriciella barbarensis]|uniref:Zinc-ribbon domain-containing protein n=1 Tax=Henriciella barbarensis TaxID=86342 RepID=A0A399R321_9PROT|nr:putative zinc-binding metallopeptidase [Henriciella barbarensis]RIJ23919.1 hypothetical protein D1224_06620 [Henriciella barbarensis]
MKLFKCPRCKGTLYFNNRACSCGTQVAFDPEAEKFEVLDAACANREQIGCNWKAASGQGSLCRACAMTEVVPDSMVNKNVPLWADTEAAKRWVLVNLGQWGWLKAGDKGPWPRFHLLSEVTSSGPAPVTMGHADGLITINVTEADPAQRVARREKLSERYRTLTGHFRHELGHYVFQRLVEDERFATAFRNRFGDERADYGAALSQHYDNGPPQGWQDNHITEYASSHPHEDWAETFAHLVHLTDMIDSANATGLRQSSTSVPDPYRTSDGDAVISAGANLGIAFNHVNRSMGLFDIYPFVIAPAVRDKLAFIRAAVAAGPREGARPKRRNWNPFKASPVRAGRT